MRPKLCSPIITTLLFAATITTTAHAEQRPDTTAVHTPLNEAPMSRDAPATREVRPATPFSMVGLTWRGADPDDIEVRVPSARGWGGWQRLEPVEAPGGARSTVPGSEPLWTGPATDVQVRATRAGSDVTRELDLVTIDPGKAPTPPKPDSRSGKPPVITRAEWGADENLMKWPPQPAEPSKAVVIHHTAESNDYRCEQSAEIVRAMYHYHAVQLQWGDIGYHVLADKCGTLFEGRTGALDQHVIGAHVLGFNRSTYGVAMMGNHDTVSPTPATLESVAAVTAWKLGSVNVPAQGGTTLVSEGGKGSKHPPGTAVPLPTIFGHRDVSNTACPGQLGYNQLGLIRDRAAAMQDDVKSP
jgi:uncharacterized protein with LGFP repeats